MVNEPAPAILPVVKAVMLLPLLFSRNNTTACKLPNAGIIVLNYVVLVVLVTRITSEVCCNVVVNETLTSDTFEAIPGIIQPPPYDSF